MPLHAFAPIPPTHRLHASPHHQIENYYQLGPATSPADRAVLDLLDQVLYEPCYDVLRTKEQLGYSVHSGTRLTHGVLGFCVHVVRWVRSASRKQAFSGAGPDGALLCAHHGEEEMLRLCSRCLGRRAPLTLPSRSFALNNRSNRSALYGCDYLNARVEAFLSSMRARIAALTPDELATHVGAVTSTKMQRDRSLSEEGHRHWEQITSGR